MGVKRYQISGAPAGKNAKRKKPKEPRLCPTCLNPMRWLGEDSRECAKYGAPTRP